jgi:hypothetical protein
MSAQDAAQELAKAFARWFDDPDRKDGGSHLLRPLIDYGRSRQGGSGGSLALADKMAVAVAAADTSGCDSEVALERALDAYRQARSEGS